MSEVCFVALQCLYHPVLQLFDLLEIYLKAAMCQQASGVFEEFTVMDDRSSNTNLVLIRQFCLWDVELVVQKIKLKGV